MAIDLELMNPIGDRSVTNADTGTAVPIREVESVEPTDQVLAECTTEAARASVERDVDGGLSRDLLACDGQWMAVATSANACAATGEAPDPGCIANQHTGYWRNDDGHWNLAGFDDCEGVLRQYPTLSDEVCQD